MKQQFSLNYLTVKKILVKLIKERSIAEIILLDVAIQKGIPITGICGGHQLINVYFGGKLANIGKLDYSKVRMDKDLELARITK